MWIELTQREQEVIREIEKITDVDYELKDNLISYDVLMSVIKDLKLEVTKRDEKLEKIQETINENYRPVTNKELYSDYEDYRLEKGIIN